MEMRNLGRSGLRVSKMGLGCNNFGEALDLEGSRRVIDAALDVGMTFFDTADVYGKRGGSEACIGEALGPRRQRVVLATKFALPMDDQGLLRGASRGYVMTALEASLRRLKTDWIDLYQLHWPDPLTPLDETLRALDDAVTQGKVRYIGCSNLPAWQVTECAWIAKTSGRAAFVSTQNEYSLLVRNPEKELIPAAQSHGMSLLPAFPLTGGLLTGKYAAGRPPPENTRFARRGGNFVARHDRAENFARVARLAPFAEQHGRSMVELACSWLACQPIVASVIAGATTVDQVIQNATAADWLLTPENQAEIDDLLDPPAR